MMQKDYFAGTIDRRDDSGKRCEPAQTEHDHIQSIVSFDSFSHVFGYAFKSLFREIQVFLRVLLINHQK